MIRTLRSVIFALILTATSAGKLTNGTLPRLNASDEIRISGLSGGGFFAAQFHVAYSSLVQGVGVLAGGPFYCAMGDIDLAEGRCMRFPEDIDVDELIEITKLTYETTRTIDNPDNMKDDRVWMLTATEDSVVATGVVEKLEKYYTHFLSDPSTQIEAVYNQTGEHSYLTLNYGSECDYLGKPYINDCDYDAAGILLQHLYGHKLNDPVDDDLGLDSGYVIEFNQREYLDEAYTLEGAALNTVGYLYVPNQCEDANAGCTVHVAFHGCEQTVWDIGETYVLDTGYNRWAAANDMIVLYPQALRTDLNPKGCWDWWGYTGEDYASKLGVQMSTVYQMIQNLL